MASSKEAGRGRPKLLAANGTWIDSAVLERRVSSILGNPAAFAALTLVVLSVGGAVWSSQRTAGWRTSIKVLAIGVLLALSGLAWKVTDPTDPTETQGQQPRIKHSSTQVVQWSDEPGDYNQSVNLDNLAALVLVGTPSMEAVELLLPKEAPRQTDYKPGDMKPGGPPVVTSLTRFSGGTQFRFGADEGSRSHVVAVASRRFLVTLLSVKSATTASGDAALLTFTFGIAEQ